MKSYEEQEMELQHGCYLANVEPINTFIIELNGKQGVLLDKKNEAYRLCKILDGEIKEIKKGHYLVTLKN